MPFIKTTDDIKLYYEQHGIGDPIIFVHEFAGDHRSWEAQVSYFSRFYKCITFCARGYPPSEVPKKVKSYDQNRAWMDIRDLMDQLNIKKTHLVGLSMGAFSTLHFGINLQNRALSLTIAGCGYGAKKNDNKNNSSFAKESENNSKKILKSGFTNFAKEYGIGPTRVQFQNKDNIGWKKFYDNLLKHDSLGSANTLLGIQSNRPNLYDIEKRISKIKVPTLIINGDEDDMCLEVGIFLKRLITSSGLVIVPKTGHTINLEEPAFFNESISKFYQAIYSKSWKNRDKRAKIILN